MAVVYDRSSQSFAPEVFGSDIFIASHSPTCELAVSQSFAPEVSVSDFVMKGLSALTIDRSLNPSLLKSPS